MDGLEYIHSLFRLQSLDQQRYRTEDAALRRTVPATIIENFKFSKKYVVKQRFMKRIYHDSSAGFDFRSFGDWQYKTGTF